MHTKKILAFSPYPPCSGGGTKATFEIFKRLNNDIKIDLITYQQEIEKLNNVNVFHFNIKGKTSMFRGIKYIFLGFVKSFYLCCKNKYDLVYIKNLSSPGIIGYFINKIFRIPLVAHTSGPDVEDLNSLSKNYGSYSGLYNIINNHFVKKELIAAKAIIANGMADQKAVKKISGMDSTIIYNGVDYKIFKPSKDVSLIRSKLKIKTNELVCIFVGRTAKEKNIGLLLKAANNFPNIKFLFIGSTEEELKIYGLISKNIFALGKQKNVYKYLQASDIFLLPSFAEGTSNALLEAMSCGLSIIAYPSGETPYLIKNDINGFITQNPPEFISKIDFLNKNRNLIKKMGDLNRKIILEKFDWNKCVKEMEVIFKEVVK